MVLRNVASQGPEPAAGSSLLFGGWNSAWSRINDAANWVPQSISAVPELNISDPICHESLQLATRLFERHQHLLRVTPARLCDRAGVRR